MAEEEFNENDFADEEFSSEDFENKNIVDQLQGLKDQALLSTFSGATPNIKPEDVFEKLKTTAIAGLAPASAGVKPGEASDAAKEVLPILGQMAGDLVPGGQIIKGAASGVLAGLGEAGKQAVEGEFKPIDILKEVGLTAISEMVFRIPGQALFKKLRASRELQEGAGKMLSIQKAQLAASGEVLPKEKVLKTIDEALSIVKDQSGSVGALFRRWRKIFETAEDGVPIRQLMEFESLLGEAAKFNSSVGGQIVQTQIKKPLMNAAAKSTRATISKMVDDAAVKIGMKDFPKLNKTVSKLIQTANEKSPGLINRLARSGEIGLGVGFATQNPIAGISTGITADVLSQPSTQGFLFNAIEKSGLGRATTLGATQGARKLQEAISGQAQ